MSSFNYTKEKTKFEKQWKCLADEYAAAGMHEKDIHAMHDFDWSVFKQERTWRIHATSIEDIIAADPEFGSALNVNTSTISAVLITHDSYSLDTIDEKYYWLKDVRNPDIRALLYQLADIDLLILHLSVFIGLNQEEIGQYLHVSQQAVSRRLARIKNFFKKSNAVGCKTAFPTA